MLNSIDFSNDSNILTKTCVLVSFDIGSMFLSIENESDIQAVKKKL